MELAPPGPRRGGRRRRLILALGLIALVLTGLVAAAPWLLSTTAGNRLVRNRLDRAFAPGRLRFETIRFSWGGPTRIAGLALDDPTGKPVLKARSASLTPGLWSFLTRPDRLGTLDLDRAAFEVQRAADGSIDLANALEGVIAGGSPDRDLTIRADGSTLRIAASGLSGPMEVPSMGLEVQVRPAPATTTLRVDLEDGPARTLRIRGEFDRWQAEPGSRAKPNLRVSATADAWPIGLGAEGLDLAGQIGGEVSARRDGGFWRTEGRMALDGLVVDGPRLRGDRVGLERVGLDWSISRGLGAAWAVDRLEATSPIGSLSVVLPLRDDPARPPRVEGRLDLAAIARQVPRLLGLRDGVRIERGTARLALSERRGEGGRREWTAEATVDDLSALDGDRALALRDPATFRALIVRDRDNLAVEQLQLRTSFLDASARGDLARGIELQGRLDLAALRHQAADWFDLDRVAMAGTSSIKAEYRRAGDGFVAEATVDLDRLRIAGVGPIPVEPDRVHGTARLDGPADPAGWPLAVSGLRASIESGPTAATVEARTEPEGTALRASGQGPIRIAGTSGRIDGSLAAHWSPADPVVLIDAMTVSARPGEGAEGSIAVKATGRLDLEAGTITLRPIEMGQGEAVAVGLDVRRDPLRFEFTGRGDLAPIDRALSAWSGRPSRGLSGRWEGSARLGPGDGGPDFAARLSLPGPLDIVSSKPTALSIRANYRVTSDRVEVPEFALSSHLGSAEVSGAIDHPGGRGEVNLKGRLALDWDALTAILAERVEPGARVAGIPRAILIRGPIRPGPGESAVEAEVGIELTHAEAFGIVLGPAALVARVSGGRIAIDPIATSLNGGMLRLDPTIDLDDPAGPVVRLGRGTSLADAAINEAVSRRVLAFVAPVLAGATEATGKVSTRIDRATFPIAGDGARRADVEGTVVFQDVQFAPGPLVRQVAGLLAPDRDLGTVRLDQPVSLAIADGRVVQRGLSVPIGRLARVDLEGSVAFDRTIALTASLPVTPEMTAGLPFLAGIASGTSLKLPIGGTLSEPRLDREAFRAGLNDLGRGILTRTAGLGALKLLEGLARPRDPNAPPPPTAAERRERQMERREDRIEKRDARRRTRAGEPMPKNR